jgi:SEC-C motif
MRKALALIAYARPEYLASVWASIQAQTIAGKPLAQTYDIHVFQDGLWDGEPAAGRSGHAEVSRWLSQLPPSITVHHQGDNLGIALHYDFVEKHLFAETSYDFVVICEDDLQLATGYMSIIDRMSDRFHDDRRVGMMSAHPADPTVSIELQHAHKDQWAPMGHSWGYGMSRSFWQRRQPLVECYLDLIRDAPYRGRDDSTISEWLRAIGFQALATSQDYVKTCATYALGAVKLSTYPNFGRPIGRTGVHFTPALFEKMGLDRTVMFDGELDSISELRDDTHRDLWQQMIHQVEADSVKVIADPQAHDVAAWEARLKAGEFHPSRIIPETYASTRAMQPQTTLAGLHRARASARNAAVDPVRRAGRCPCGSGKRYKHCHGRMI